jgi:hypothetical protein
MNISCTGGAIIETWWQCPLPWLAQAIDNSATMRNKMLLQDSERGRDKGVHTVPLVNDDE